MRYPRPRRREAAPWLNRSRLQVESLESRDLLSVTVGLGQSGIGYTGVYPPDTIGAAGPNHFVEAVNLTMAIYNKSTGAQISSKSLSTFFSGGGLTGIQSLSDPFAAFDTFTNQFVLGAIDYSSSDSRLDLAVSNTSDPTGAWTARRYDMSRDSLGGPYLSDYPRFGYNRDAYVVSFNMFPNGSGSQHVDTIAVSKSNPTTSYTYAWPTSTAGLPGVSPTIMHDAAAGGPMWFVGTGGGTSIKVIKMTNVLSSTPTLQATPVTVPSYSSMSAPHQPGGTMSWTFDTRIINAAQRNNLLVAAHSVKVGGNDVARWYEFNTSGATPTLVQSGNAGASGADAYFPSIDINAANALGMTYIESSSTEFMSIWVTGRTTSDPTGQMETGASPTALHGTTNYTISRCGDYSGTSVDPGDNTTFWSANEFKGSATWNTGFAKYSLGGSVGAATHYSVTAVTSTVAGNPFSLTVTALDASGSVATGYRGTVTFDSNDPQGATLPDDYTFTAADSGVHTFSNAAALYTAGSRSITATDTVTPSITGSATVSVTPGAAAFFAITSPADGGTVAGNAFDITVRAYDAYGNAATGYRGTVTFSSGDPYGASLPNNYTFNALDNGTHIFRGLTALYTAGTWDVTATDVSSGIAGSDYIGVTAALAAGFYVLAASSVSSGEGFDVGLYAIDPYGNIDTNYGGTVTWTTTDPDPGVVLPADYTFQPSDQGAVGFYAADGNGFALITPGDQLIIATDTVSGISGSADVFVTSPAPRAGRGHANAALATALPTGTAALPAAPVSAERTLAVSGVAAGLAPEAQSPRQALPAADGHGLVTGARADAAVLDLVLADWNEGLNPIADPV